MGRPLGAEKGGEILEGEGGEGGGVGGENITVHRVALSDIAAFIAAKRADGCGIDVRVLLLLGQGILAGE